MGLLALGAFGAGAVATRGRVTETRDGAVVSFVLEDSVSVRNLDRGRPLVGPDGSVVLLGEDGLMLRSPGSVDLTLLDGTNGARWAGFSPDGQWLSFMNRDGLGETSRWSLERMPSSGGPIQTLWRSPATAAPIFSRPEWGDDGQIYLGFGPDLLRVPEAGGVADTLISLPTDRVIADVSLLPGSRGALVTTANLGPPFDSRILLVDVDTRDSSTLVADGFEAEWVSSGHIVYAHGGGALYALSFDAARLEATGDAVPVLDNLGTFLGLFGNYDVSPDGTLVYLQAAAFDPTSLSAGGLFSFAFMDLGGNLEMLSLQSTDHADAEISPDGGKLAYTRDDKVWIFDLDLGSNRLLTEEGTRHHDPRWSRDGTEVVFSSDREGSEGLDIYVRAVDGSSSARRLAGSRDDDYANYWFEDGTILFETSAGNVRAARDLYRTSSIGDQDAEPLLEADWIEQRAVASPDGRWLAYLSSENGGLQVFVRRWPDLSGKTQVTDFERPMVFNSQVVWSGDSRTMYFESSNSLWSASLTDDAGPEFELRDLGVDLSSTTLSGWHPDGRLLVSVLAGESGSTTDSGPGVGRLIVVTNWLTALRERVGAGN